MLPIFFLLFLPLDNTFFERFHHFNVIIAVTLVANATITREVARYFSCLSLHSATFSGWCHCHCHCHWHRLCLDCGHGFGVSRARLEIYKLEPLMPAGRDTLVLGYKFWL